MRSRRCCHHYVDGVVLTPHVIDWTPTAAATGRGVDEADPMMQLEPSIAVYLSDDELFMIEIAVEILDDEFLHEIATRLDDGIPDRGPTLTYLPQRYDSLYDVQLVRRWYICFLVVAERLAHGWEPLRCRGEELALRAIIECARTQLELNNLDQENSYFPLENALFEDLDHLMLWHNELDGIDDPETPEGNRLGVAPLHPSTWFQPLDPSRPVHPLAEPHE